MSPIPPPINSVDRAQAASLPRRSSLVRKRDDNSDSLPSSPSKRSKVTFDSDVEVRTLSEFSKPPELIEEEVRSAFRDKSLGDNGGYDRIKAVYSREGDDNEDDEEVKPEALRHYAIAMLKNVPSLNKTNRDLVHLMIKSHWLGRDDDYFSLFTRLIGSIVTSSTSFLEVTLLTLIDNLKASPQSSCHLPGEPSIPKRKLYSRVHHTLQYLMRLIPSVSNSLRVLLDKTFPHFTDTLQAHVIYTKNLLKIVEYAPELRADILASITEHLLEIDVQVQVDIEDLEDDIDEDLLHCLPLAPKSNTAYMLNDVDDNSDGSDDESDFDEDTDEGRRTHEIKKNVEKMDSLLDILFSYYSSTSSSAKAGVSRNLVVDHLMSQFDTIILPSHRSRHTQFLLFHHVQQSAEDIDQFVGVCASKVFDKKLSNIVRQNAAAYLGSFVARGMKVPAGIVRVVFEYISGELDRFRKEHEPTCRGPDLHRYSVYYCLVQTLLYMFCFRWRDLEAKAENDEEDEDDLDVSYTQGHQWKVDVKGVFARHIFSKLNPLKVCSPTIVNEFANVARHLGVIYVYHLLETNKRVRLSRQMETLGPEIGIYGQTDRETALSLDEGEARFQLDAYFPFDPYNLPKSKRWMEGEYREWTPLPGLADAEDEESESDADLHSDLEVDIETDMTGMSS